MQITRQAEYAVRTLMELARIPPGELMSTRKISENQEIPEVFLKKTIQLLDRAGLVATRRGKEGGVRLSVAPEDITIADVLKVIEGEVALNPCLSGKNYCKREETCPVRKILGRAQEAMLAELGKETFADLVKGNALVEE
ncbi:MAG: Rrf2 family transcriptional regulator [Candidatus Syntrophonatronum acetioxidans]|uniref:Rrf2 family transcriptional regulator n=1 Tax=Candidatus Syntrophonatronum acetioxidans TaxID=1795816 RepID=A0A424YGF8_9FIRM|nr:MAG: Rrf2 family transcriptional regulator [Candidatus Syntrophonatronum acetioxidans]